MPRTPRARLTFLPRTTSILYCAHLGSAVPVLLVVVRMTAPAHTVERLWSLDDGTMCLLVDRVDAPRFEVCVLRGDDVLRQNRLYARGSAQMLAETWRVTLAAMRAELAEQRGIDSVQLASA